MNLDPHCCSTTDLNQSIDANGVRLLFKIVPESNSIKVNRAKKSVVEHANAESQLSFQKVKSEKSLIDSSMLNMTAISISHAKQHKEF